MSVKSALAGIGFEKRALIYTAGEEIKGTIQFNGGTRGIKLFEFKLTLIRRTDYTHYPAQLKEKKSFHHLFATLNTSSVISTTLSQGSSSPVNVSANSTKTIDFSVPLPSSLWSSFVVQNAYTWYGLMLSGRGDSQYAKKEILILKKDFVIIGSVPLPLEIPPALKRIARDPGGGESKMMVKVPRHSVLPGETISFNLKVYNATQIGFSGVKGAFQQNIRYNFPIKRKMGNPMAGNLMKTSESRVLWSGESSPISPFSYGAWEGEVLVPYVVPTGLGTDQCPELNVSYALTFVLSQLVKLKISVDIFIGTGISESGEELSAAIGDHISLAYGSEMASDSTSVYELDWDSRSLSSVDSGVCWTIVDESASSTSSRSS